MVWRGLVRLLGAPLFALFAALLLSTGPVMAADTCCSVNVDPQTAIDGSVFTFTGTGFMPTQLLLQQPNTSLPTLFYLMVVGFGLCGGVFLSRRLGAAPSAVRH